MRNLLRILVGVAILALAGCVYPGYTYVRGGYGDAGPGGYYTGNAYYYGDGYAQPYYYGGYGCCYYAPSINIGLGYYGGGYYRRGYRGYRGGSYNHRGYGGQRGGTSSHAWHGNVSHGHGGGSHDSWHGH